MTIGVRVAAQVDDNAHTAAVRLIVEGRDAAQSAYRARAEPNLFNEACLVDLIRQLRDNDAKACRSTASRCGHSRAS